MIKKENLSPDGKYRISATNELAVEELEANPQIKEICVLDERDDTQEYVDEVPSAESYVKYTREEYTKIKNQIQRIKNVVRKVVGDNPNVNEENKEKNIFMAIYLMLGLIKFDYQTVRLEEQGYEEQEKSTTIRNMLGGLIENNSVCLGYAQILKNVLSEFGIDSRVVIGIPTNGKGDAHAWNITKLDGKEYQCDLTEDAKVINYEVDCPKLRFCMTGKTDFGHGNYDREVLDDGISFDEQREFMQYYFDAFKIIYNLDYEIDDQIVSELMDESTNPIYVYNSDNIDDENNIDEEELKDVYKQVMGLFDKFKSKPVIFGEQEIGKATIDIPTIKKSEAQRQVTRDEQVLEQGSILE